MPNSLIGVRVKINRAQKHLADLNAAVHAFESRQPYDTIIDNHTQPGCELYRFHQRDAIPVEWGALIGDCLHNMRSSLDLLANDLVLENGGTPADYTAFPIGSSETNFRTSAIKRISGASADAIKFVERLKPYDGGNEALYRLHRLNIADKHQILIPVVAANDSIGIKNNIRSADPLFAEWINRRTSISLKDGDELFRYHRVGSGDLQDKTEFHFGFEIAFGEGTICGGNPIIPTLTELLDYAKGAIDAFANAIFKAV